MRSSVCALAPQATTASAAAARPAKRRGIERLRGKGADYAAKRRAARGAAASVSHDQVRKRRVPAARKGIMPSMVLDPSSCYRALATHDVRFDGRFFVGVSSTRIYCRPVCRVRTPRAENCRFFQSAAAAEVAGYRPCLRCRPELAPGYASVDAAERLAQAAVELIDGGILDDGGLEALAARLGVTSRHVRRLFDR